MSLHPLLEALESRLLSSLQELSQELEGLSEEVLTKRPALDQWSIREIIAHLALVEKGNARLTEMLLEKARKENLILSGEPKWPTETPDFKEKIQAPERVLPKESTAFEEAWGQLQESRKKVVSMVPDIATFDLGLLTFPHPVFGERNLYQWLNIGCVHMSVHIEQVKRVKKQLESV